MSYFAASKKCKVQVLSPVIEGNIIVKSDPTDKVLVNGEGIYVGELKVTVSGCVLSGYTQSGSATITIKPTLSKKVKIEGQNVLVKGDSGVTESVVTFVSGNSSITSLINVQITDAGQDKVKVV